MSLAFEQAMSFVRKDYHAALSRRDKLVILSKEAAAKGDIIGALGYQSEYERQAGRVDGLSTALQQITAIRKRVEG